MTPPIKQDQKIIITDDELLKKLYSGDEKAFELIYQKYWSLLFASAFSRVPDKTICQDIVQDLFLDMWKRKATLKIQNLEAYLKSSVRFKVYRVLTKMPLDSPYYEEFENMLVSAWFADDKIVEEELSTLLDLWIQALSPKKRKIFILHFIEEMSTEEIAKRLNISRKTVQNQVASAYNEIRNRYAHYLTVLMIFDFFK